MIIEQFIQFNKFFNELNWFIEIQWNKYREKTQKNSIISVLYFIKPSQFFSITFKGWNTDSQAIETKLKHDINTDESFKSVSQVFYTELQVIKTVSQSLESTSLLRNKDKDEILFVVLNITRTIEYIQCERGLSWCLIQLLIKPQKVLIHLHRSSSDFTRATQNAEWIIAEVQTRLRISNRWNSRQDNETTRDN